MATTWDDKMKCVVRRTTHGFFCNRQYGMMVDLPGNLCLSVKEAREHGAIRPNAILRLAEKVPAVVPEIEASMADLGYDRDHFSLFHGNLDDIVYREGDSIGLLNADYMAQPTPFDLDLLQRTPFQDGAGIIATFHNPATRLVSNFMNGIHEALHGSPTSPYYRSMLSQLKRVYRYVKMDNAGRIVDDTSDREKYLRWAMTLLACMSYGLRYHSWTPAMVMTYTPNGSYVKMTTIVLTGVTANEGAQKSLTNTMRWQSEAEAVDSTLADLRDYYQL